MLLVLFNTALSNLIIFRNNFALSRDVANMFTVSWDSQLPPWRLESNAMEKRVFKHRHTYLIPSLIPSCSKGYWQS